MIRACFGLATWPTGLLALGVLVFVCLATASTASNSVPSTIAGVATDTLTANEVAPSACAGIGGLSSIALAPATPVSGNNLNLGSGSPSILGSDTSGGRDCCVGGTSSDVFKQSCRDGVIVGS